MGELTRKGQSRPVTREDLELYPRAQALQAQHRVPVLQHSDDPHEYLYFPLLDGTGQDVNNPGQLPTNVGVLSKQLEQLAGDPRNRIGYRYVEGVGAQDNLLPRLYDGYRPFTWDEKIEEAYRALSEQTWKWRDQDPEAQIRIAHVGYSRGAVLAAGLARLVDRYGIADPENLKFGRDDHGNITVASQRPPLVAPGQTAQAMGLFDPVATNMPHNYDARPAPSVISAFSQLAIHERRTSFPHQSILDAELTVDARFLRVPVPGGHSNVGGGNRQPGLESAAFNGMVDYLNGLRDEPLFAYRTLPGDPALFTVYQARGVTAVPGLDSDGERNLRDDLANCKIVSPCHDGEEMNEALAGRFEYRQLQPLAPMPALSNLPVELENARAATRAATTASEQLSPGASLPPARNGVATPDQPDHPQHRLLLQIREQVRDREREGAIHFQDEFERERFCRYALAACKDNRDELKALYPDRDAPASERVARADHVVIGSKQYAFVVQGDIHDVPGTRVAFTMDRARETPVEQSDLKLAQANQQTAQQGEPARQQDLAQAQEEPMRRVLAR